MGHFKMLGLGLGQTPQISTCFNASYLLSTFSYLNTLIIRRNRVSDDVDYISTNPKDLKPFKAPPPAIWPIPEFQPREINNNPTIKDLAYNNDNLPDHVKPDDSYAIFSLFFNNSTLKILT